MNAQESSSAAKSSNAVNSSNAETNWSLGAALGAAVAASACCTIPLALVSLGIGGAWIGSLTALAPYRWIFVGLAIAALAYAGYNEWRLSQRPGCDCQTIFSSRARRSLLGVGALAVLVLVASPWLLGVSPSSATQQAQAAAAGSGQGGASATPTSFRQVVLEVEGMTCAACPRAVKTALEGVDGVYSVEATYKPPEAVVRFDPTAVSVEDLTKATADTGFPSSPKSSS
ncbi:mercuric transport protein [Salinibacter ruber]|uniref:mercuric transporter MerT family protein n=2 Tax=Salinibacter ruber TaxID=146919 RepID=UPI002169D381|nr:mercuric transporter MerT family protein [Salinibacter ruber]MCS3638938.1 mercuric transport protein [Salinibacter ruber]MCS3698629.1 mercuric transport protein [Salinibacter ruber]MCS3708086.1 mercuric transport protein [Salinibacter ruber]MCS3830841.1 mercuric transport protein [Salinibacter ruber]MCS3854742.1 mercuric transport protein [Salinibacter ruber]